MSPTSSRYRVRGASYDWKEALWGATRAVLEGPRCLEEQALLGGRHDPPRAVDDIRVHRDGVDAPLNEPLRQLGINRRPLPADGACETELPAGLQDVANGSQDGGVPLVEERGEHLTVPIHAEH